MPLSQRHIPQIRAFVPAGRKAALAASGAMPSGLILLLTLFLLPHSVKGNYPGTGIVRIVMTVAFESVFRLPEGKPTASPLPAYDTNAGNLQPAAGPGGEPKPANSVSGLLHSISLHKDNIIEV